MIERTTLSMAAEETRSPRLCLVGILGGTAISIELPQEGSVVIGRAPEVEVRIDHPSISRRHAALHVGETLMLEDLGSSNGTWVHDERLAANQRVELRVGESLRVGAVSLVVMSRIEAPRIRAFWTHGYFEARVAEECARAAATNGTFAVLRVHLEQDHTDLAKEVLSQVLGSADVAGVYAPTEYEALLIPTGDRDPDDVAARVVELFEENSLRAMAGVAHYPADGRDAYVLLAKASSVARDDGTTAGFPTPEGQGEHGEAMRRVFALCAQVAKGDINVLVLGETGVGKEVMAERIHAQSPRAAQPLLRLNCATLSETLLEGELFGYERGAFTGADRMKQGLLETAQGGTVFLDEIGELPLGLQAKLLRVIDDRKLLRIGGLKPLTIDVRFVAATNRDLEVEVAAGRFRGDLYYRLNGVALHIPPLRERRGEIPGLVRHFATVASRGQRPPALAPEALELLVAYAWPGNIRELRNIVERAVLLCGDAPIGVDHLPVEKMRATVASAPRRHRPSAQIGVSIPASEKTPMPELVAPSLKAELESIERNRIEEALKACAGNQTAAAKMLGIPRPTLLKRLDAYGIVRPRKR